MAIYTYSIQNNFLNKKVNSDKLSKEIQNSNITIALDYINISEDGCNIVFKSSISEEEKMNLDNIVSSHDGEPIFNSAFDSQGRQIVVPALANYEGKIYNAKGFRENCPPNTTTNIYISFSEERLLFGGIYKIEGTPNENDVINIDICVPDGQGGYIPVINIVESIYVEYFPEKKISSSNTGKEFPAGLVLRVQYVNTGENEVHLGFVVEAWK